MIGSASVESFWLYPEDIRVGINRVYSALDVPLTECFVATMQVFYDVFIHDASLFDTVGKLLAATRLVHCSLRWWLGNGPGPFPSHHLKEQLRSATGAEREGSRVSQRYLFRMFSLYRSIRSIIV